MAELPEIVKQRLVRQAGGEHPDPDLLTAFAEGALGERERRQVLAHLSACAGCREVVSLAMPETPALQPAPAPVRSGWLSWPVLRWGAVTAMVVVVATAVMLRQTRKSPVIDGGSTAALAKHEEGAAAKPQVKAKESRTEAKDSFVAENGTSKPKQQSRDQLMIGPDERRKQTETAAVQNAPTARADSVRVSSAVAEIQQQGAVRSGGPSQAAMQQALRQSADQQVFGAGVAGGIQPQSQLSKTPQAAPTKQAAAVPAAPARARVAENVVVADRAEAPAAVGGSLEAATAKPRMKSLMRVSSAVRWRISSSGNVERSLDSGASWRVVPVQGGASFRAVSAIDGDVWAGGAAGVLYHSTDGGQSWARVLPRWGDVALTSDISRVEFTDNGHGLVTTASGETWTTSDGGRTWTLRRP